MHMLKLKKEANIFHILLLSSVIKHSVDKMKSSMPMSSRREVAWYSVRSPISSISISNIHSVREKSEIKSYNN